jgi:hypothetical protein
MRARVAASGYAGLGEVAAAVSAASGLEGGGVGRGASAVVVGAGAGGGGADTMLFLAQPAAINPRAPTARSAKFRELFMLVITPFHLTK